MCNVSIYMYITVCGVMWYTSVRCDHITVTTSLYTLTHITVRVYRT